MHLILIGKGHEVEIRLRGAGSVADWFIEEFIGRN